MAVQQIPDPLFALGPVDFLGREDFEEQFDGLARLGGIGLFIAERFLHLANAPGWLDDPFFIGGGVGIPVRGARDMLHDGAEHCRFATGHGGLVLPIEARGAFLAGEYRGAGGGAQS